MEKARKERRKGREVKMDNRKIWIDEMEWNKI